MCGSHKVGDHTAAQQHEYDLGVQARSKDRAGPANIRLIRATICTKAQSPLDAGITWSAAGLQPSVYGSAGTMVMGRPLPLIG